MNDAATPRTDAMDIDWHEQRRCSYRRAMEFARTLERSNASLVAALEFARRILGANECGTDDVLGPIDDALALAKA